MVEAAVARAVDEDGSRERIRPRHRLRHGLVAHRAVGVLVGHRLRARGARDGDLIDGRQIVDAVARPVARRRAGQAIRADRGRGRADQRPVARQVRDRHRRPAVGVGRVDLLLVGVAGARRVAVDRHGLNRNYGDTPVIPF